MQLPVILSIQFDSGSILSRATLRLGLVIAER